MGWAVVLCLGCGSEHQVVEAPFVGTLGSGQATLYVTDAQGDEQEVQLSSVLPFSWGGSFGCPGAYYGPTLADAEESPTWIVELGLAASWMVAPAPHDVEQGLSAHNLAAPYDPATCVRPASVSLRIDASPVAGLANEHVRGGTGRLEVVTLSHTPRMNAEWQFDATWFDEESELQLRVVGSAGVREEDETQTLPEGADDYDATEPDYGDKLCQQLLRTAAADGCTSPFLLPEGAGGAGG